MASQAILYRFVQIKKNTYLICKPVLFEFKKNEVIKCKLREKSVVYSTLLTGLFVHLFILLEIQLYSL